jgi:hypothetical protein
VQPAERIRKAQQPGCAGDKKPILRQRQGW